VWSTLHAMRKRTRSGSSTRKAMCRQRHGHQGTCPCASCSRYSWPLLPLSSPLRVCRREAVARSRAQRPISNGHCESAVCHASPFAGDARAALQLRLVKCSHVILYVVFTLCFEFLEVTVIVCWADACVYPL
jgi:hypothetical protein